MSRFSEVEIFYRRILGLYQRILRFYQRIIASYRRIQFSTYNPLHENQINGDDKFGSLDFEFFHKKETKK